MVGMTQQGIVSIEAGDSKRPRKLRELANALETTEAYLLGETDDPTAGFEPIKGMLVIPVRGDVAAGLWLEFDLPAEEPSEWVPFVPRLGVPLEAVFALRVKGNSVDKVAPDGSLLICISYAEAGLAIQNGDLVVVERRRDQEGRRQVTVKRLHERRNGYELVPESTDPYWKPVFLKRGSSWDDEGGEEARIVAKVEWIAQKPDRKNSSR